MVYSFNGIFNLQTETVAPCPASIGPLTPVGSAERFEADFSSKEVEAHVSKTRETAPGKDGIRYSLLKKRDPGYLIPMLLFN